MKADALMRFILLGNRSLEEFAVLLARISVGIFFAISGGNKLFVASNYKQMYETIVGAGIPFPHVMTYFVSSVELVGGCLLIIGLISSLCCVALLVDMIVAITTVELATISKALSFIDWLDDFLYLPQVMYIIIFLWLISSGPGRLSVDHWIAVCSGLLVPNDCGNIASLSHCCSFAARTYLWPPHRRRGRQAQGGAASG